MSGITEKNENDLYETFLKLIKKVELQEILIKELKEKIKIQEDYIEGLRDFTKVKRK